MDRRRPCRIVERLDDVRGQQATGPSIVERVEKSVASTFVPVAGYADKNAEDAIAAVKNLAYETELAAVRTFEMANKNRVTVLRAIESG